MKRCCASRRWWRSPRPIPLRSCAWSTAAPTPPPIPTSRSGRSSALGSTGCALGLAPPPILDRDPAHLGVAEAKRFGVGALPASLEDALRALAEDDVVRGWLSATLYEAYVGVKQAELDAVADLDLGEVCKRYAAIY